MTWELSRLSRDETAFVIVDMQRDFVEPGGACFIPGAQKVVPAIAEAAEVFRQARVPVIHVMTVWRPGSVDMSPFTTSEELRHRGLREGEVGSEPVDLLALVVGDYTVTKKRYSAFFQTDLDLLLSGLGVSSLVVTGVATNFCVRSTVHDASFRGLMSIVCPETCASYTEQEHEGSLRDISAGFGQVVPLGTLLDVVRKW